VPPKGRLGEEASVALQQGGVQVAPLALHHLVAFAHAVNDGRAASEVKALFAWLNKTLSLQTRKQTNVKTRKRA
jgi:hypothetical protein